MDDDYSDTDLFISYSLDVSLMRFIENMLIPSHLSFTVAIERAADATDAQLELALTKWKYFIDNIVSKSIVFSHANDTALDILLDENGVNRTGNLFMLTPEEPSDEMLGAVLQAKFTALGAGHLFASSVEVTSDNLHGLSFMLVGDHGSDLPATVEGYLGVESFWEKPWWHRNDASSIDIIKVDDEAQPPAWAYSLDFLDRSSKAKDQAMPTRPSFKPTIIEGGKHDEPK